MKHTNSDRPTILGFGEEWKKFDQTGLQEAELHELFERYFDIFPWHKLPKSAKGFDMGCGSGRWAKLVAPRVSTLHCVDPSDAIGVAEKNLADYKNCVFHRAGVADKVLASNSMDFGYSLGVLHHVPDTSQAIKECVQLLKKDAPLLLYLYYDFEDRGLAFKLSWIISDLLRKILSRLPFWARFASSQIIAALVYLPLSKLSLLFSILGMQRMADSFPLSAYKNLSFYTMRTDALDRFGTRLEQRFSQGEIRKMMEDAGLKGVVFSQKIPYWVALGYKR